MTHSKQQFVMDSRNLDDAVWNHAVFSKNRDRLLTSDVAQRFFAEVMKQARRFMSDEHITVDGTLIQAWASPKSFRSKDGYDDGDGTSFHGQKRYNKTHESTTDAEARLYKKSYGKESKLSYLGHALVENRNGLIAAAMVTHADGYAERDAALLRLAEKQASRSRRITVGADKAYDTKDFVRSVRESNVTPHVTKNDKGRMSNLDRRTTHQPGYAMVLLIPAVFASQLVLIVLFFSISSFASSAWSTMLLVLPADLFPSSVASVSGMSGTGGGIGTILSAFVIGFVLDHYSFKPVLVAASLIPLLGTGLVLLLVRNGKAETPNQTGVPPTAGMVVEL